MARSEFSSGYSTQVLAHFRQPRHARPLVGANVVSGTAGSRRAGVQVTFQLRIEAGQIVETGYQVFGSPHAIAACSLAAEMVIGRPARTDSVPPGRELAAALELPVERTGVALVVEDAILAALTQSESR